MTPSSSRRSPQKTESHARLAAHRLCSPAARGRRADRASHSIYVKTLTRKIAIGDHDLAALHPIGRAICPQSVHLSAEPACGSSSSSCGRSPEQVEAFFPVDVALAAEYFVGLRALALGHARYQSGNKWSQAVMHISSFSSALAARMMAADLVGLPVPA